MNAWLDLPGFREAVAQVVENAGRTADDGFLDVESAAQYLCTTPKAIYRAVERGRIPHSRRDGRLLFDRRELRAYVEGGR